MEMLLIFLTDSSFGICLIKGFFKMFIYYIKEHYQYFHALTKLFQKIMFFYETNTHKRTYISRNKSQKIMTGSDYVDFDRALNVGLKLIKTQENPNLGLLIITGINLGVRIENLLQFTFTDLRNESVTILEGKTGKKRTLIVNDNIRKALALFDKEYNGYAFKSQKNTIYSPQHVNRLLKKYFKGKISSHSLRKSFGRRVWENDDQSERSLIYLSELFQHSSISITRIYLGIRQAELNDIYINL